MARLTEDARFLGATGDKVLLRFDFVTASPLRHADDGFELLIYHADKYEHVLQTYGVFMRHAEAIDLLAMIDSALCKHDRYHAEQCED